MSDRAAMSHPLSIDVVALYSEVNRSMGMKGKEAEHKAAVKRVEEVIYAASWAWHSGAQAAQSGDSTTG